MRSKFDEQLALLNRELTQMGAMCEEAIGLASEALAKDSKEIAAKVSPVDTEIDHMERTIENLCLKLLLQQQPVAKDLRQISAALKMITDMERIGDQADDIAEIISYMEGHDPNHCADILQMANEAIQMVTESVNSYVQKDMDLAEKAIAHDDVVDEYFEKVKSHLIDMIANQPDDGKYALDLLMIAKYFERIGDHAVNIAEWVVFSITGVHKGEEES